MNTAIRKAETNRLIAKILDIDFNASPITPEEAKILEHLEDGLIKQAQEYAQWLETPEAKEAFQNSARREVEIFDDIRENIREIYHDTSENVNDIIEEIYKTGEAKGYNDIRQVAVYTDASKQALQFLKDYNFNLIKNASDDFIDMIQEEIFVGMASSLHPYQIAGNLLNSRFETLPGKTLTPMQRARMIARTETARAQTTGTMQAYANYGVEEVDVITAGDGNVCAICKKNETRNPHPLDSSTVLCPAHPNCRCAIAAHVKHYEELKPHDTPQIITNRKDNFENWFFEFDNLKYHIRGNTPKSRKNFLKKYNVVHSGIEGEYLDFLKLYTGPGDSHINGYLRGLKTKPEARKEWNKLAKRKKLDISFDRALGIKDEIFEKYGVILQENIMVCRRENERFMVVGNERTYTDKGFLSTSIYEDAKKETYGDELNFILIPKGTKILYLEGITLTEDDFEVLLPPATELKFIGNYKIDQKIWTI